MADSNPNAQPSHGRANLTEQGYHYLIEDCTDSIFITDLDGTVLEANLPAARLADLPREDLVGRSLNSDRAPSGLQTLSKVLPSASSQAELHQRLVWHVANREWTIDLHTRHITYAGRPAIQWLLHDQTEQREGEQARDEHIYMIVHDLRNPLGNIISSLELLKDSLLNPNVTPAPMALVNIALRSSRRISLLVESLMDMTRMEAGQFVLSTTTARLDTLIDHAIEFVRPTADRKRIPLSVDIESGLPPVLIDVNMIERVVVNLLDNACKFVMPGQPVTVSARRVSHHEVAISVRDAGPGIAPEDQARLFQKFSRGAGIGGQTPGTGLGLAFCKMAIETHGGRISVDSQPGQGSTFTFTLPVEAT